MLFSANAMATEQKAWLIGGGNILHNSQEQIEKNVLWLDELFRNNFGEKNYKVYFGLGKIPGNDVLYWSNTDKLDDLVFQYIYNKNAQTGLKYRRHTLEPINGGTQKQALVRSLLNDFSKLRENQAILFVYNGHGGREYNNEKNNYLKLWGNTRLTVTELGALFDRAPESTVVRFVLTQCYSGAFYNLTLSNNKQLRCGFMAESDVRQSEGCALETNPEEFRDYTTYFFAAPGGKTRTGSDLLSDPDTDNNGRVSYRESHLYTLRSAKNKDLSRSSSEVYLEKWQPWYLRWQPFSTNSNSIYWQIAEDVAKLNKLPNSNSELQIVRSSTVKHLKQINAKVDTLEQRIKKLQKIIQLKITEKWPNFKYSIKGPHVVINADTELKIKTMLQTSPDYSGLVDAASEYRAMLNFQLEIERKLAQIDKIARLKKIAWLEGLLPKLGSRDEIQRYKDLLRCEESGYLHKPGKISWVTKVCTTPWLFGPLLSCPYALPFGLT